MAICISAISKSEEFSNGKKNVTVTCVNFADDLVQIGVELRVSVEAVVGDDICGVVFTSKIVGKGMLTLTHFVTSQTLIVAIIMAALLWFLLI